jgi:hypothetical protein
LWAARLRKLCESEAVYESALVGVERCRHLPELSGRPGI